MGLPHANRGTFHTAVLRLNDWIMKKARTIPTHVLIIYLAFPLRRFHRKLED